MSKKFRLVGINDDTNVCSCCGRDDLKRVLWLLPLDQDGNPEGEPIPYGSSCGAKALGWAHPTSSTTKTHIENEARKAMAEFRQAAYHRIFQAAVATTVTRGTNRFGTPKTDVLVNGEIVSIVGRGPWAAQGTDDDVRVTARRQFASNKSSSLKGF